MAPTLRHSTWMVDFDRKRYLLADGTVSRM